VTEAEAPSTRRQRAGAISTAAGALLLAVAVLVIYRSAIGSYLFNDDFGWFNDAHQFAFGNLFHLGRYNHFYRPVVEVYFYAGQQMFGCDALPFHLVSVGIHLLTTLVLFCFARDLTSDRRLAFLTALFFCTQPGYGEAVAWVAAITDLLPGLWFLLTLWLYLRFLQRGRAMYYGTAIASFTACLLTHETSATLLPMLVVLEATVCAEVGAPLNATWLLTRVRRYAPFAVLLAASLVITYVVNSRSYLIREGHYRFGWHAISHMLQFILSLYVGPRGLPSYVVIVAVTALLAWRGTARVRFAVVFLFVTLAPASFFTWGNASRYLYVPAAAFALLLADAVLSLERRAAAWISPAPARALAVVLAAALAIRFAVYAEKGARSFRELTRPYERLVAAVRRASPSGVPAGAVTLTAADVANVPDRYVDDAAGAAFCAPPIHIVVP
jgi:hypothetical protein